MNYLIFGLIFALFSHTPLSAWAFVDVSRLTPGTHFLVSPMTPSAHQFTVWFTYLDHEYQFNIPANTKEEAARSLAPLAKDPVFELAMSFRWNSFQLHRSQQITPPSDLTRVQKKRKPTDSPRSESPSSDEIELQRSITEEIAHQLSLLLPTANNIQIQYQGRWATLKLMQVIPALKKDAQSGDWHPQLKWHKAVYDPTSVSKEISPALLIKSQNKLAHVWFRDGSSDLKIFGKPSEANGYWSPPEDFQLLDYHLPKEVDGTDLFASGLIPAPRSYGAANYMEELLHHIHTTLAPPAATTKAMAKLKTDILGPPLNPQKAVSAVKPRGPFTQNLGLSIHLTYGLKNKEGQVLAMTQSHKVDFNFIPFYREFHSQNLRMTRDLEIGHSALGTEFITFELTGNLKTGQLYLTLLKNSAPWMTPIPFTVDTSSFVFSPNGELQPLEVGALPIVNFGDKQNFLKADGTGIFFFLPETKTTHELNFGISPWLIVSEASYHSPPPTPTTL